jgi:hypothetical protein
MSKNLSNVRLPTKLVEPHYLIVQMQEQKNLTNFILDTLKSIPIEELILDPDFLKYIAQLIENEIKCNTTKLTSKPDKMSILVSILKTLFPTISDSDINNSKKIVEFLLVNAMVKKVELIKVFSNYLSKRFFGRD